MTWQPRMTMAPRPVREMRHEPRKIPIQESASQSG